MNATLVMMTAALSTGGGPGGCVGCGVAEVPHGTPIVHGVAMAACDPCAASPGHFSRLRSLSPFGGMRSSGCDPCGSSPGLFAKLKARFARGCHSDPCPCPTPCGDPCGHGVAHGPADGGCALPAVPHMPSAAPAYGTPQAMPQHTLPQQSQPQAETPRQMPRPVDPKPADPRPMGTPDSPPKTTGSILPQVTAPLVGGGPTSY